MTTLTDWQHTTYTLRAMYGDDWRMEVWTAGAWTDTLYAVSAAVDDAIDARRGMGRGDR